MLWRRLQICEYSGREVEREAGAPRDIFSTKTLICNLQTVRMR